jgi:hypothetical protein
MRCNVLREEVTNVDVGGRIAYHRGLVGHEGQIVKEIRQTLTFGITQVNRDHKMIRRELV